MTPRPAPRRGSGDTLAGPRPPPNSGHRATTAQATGSTPPRQVGTGYDYATVAYNTVTGATLWVRRYNGTANTNDYAVSVAVGPAGDKVLVTGTSQQQGNPYPGKYATLAYNAVTGTQLWVRRYNFPDHGDSHASAVTVSSSGVFVTGYSQGATTGPDYATIAYQG